MIFNFLLCRKYIACFFAFSLCVFISCGGRVGGDEGQLRDEVEAFSAHYFNWRFIEAGAYCTPESYRWLSYASSNVLQTDIDSLKKKPEGAEAVIDKVEYVTDSVAVVTLEVKNVLVADTLGRPSRSVSRGHATLEMVLRDKWTVCLTSLPRIVRAD